VRPVALRDVITDVVEALKGRKATEGRSLDFVIDIPDDLPDLYADYDRIMQILTNIVSNAYSYTPDGGTVTIRAVPVENGVQLDIADTGIGIPKDQQSRIFERFFRGEDPMVMRTAGTGLGLAIVHNLVNMHRGRVWFESEEGVGTTFSVWLPYLMSSSGSTR
jgi:signal transduction histidine kinase